MPETPLPYRLVAAAEQAMPVEISNPRDAAAITVAVLRELHDAGYQTITMDGFGLETDIDRVADEIVAIAANPANSDTSSPGVAHHRHRDAGGLRVFVAGKPAPQGSKNGRAVYKGCGADRVFTGKIAQVESSKALPAWRADVRAAVAELVDDQPPITGPIAVELLFVMPRPASTPKSRTPAAVKRPDLDKLARAILDAIGSAGAWGDDSQVTDLHAVKRIAGVDERPGAWITITPLEA